MTDLLSSVQSVPAVKSQPVYAPLSPDMTARHHMLVADSAGLAAVQRVISGVGRGKLPVEIYWLGKEQQQFSGHVLVFAFDDIKKLRRALAERLSSASMGLRLYLAGREAFLWQVNKTALDAGLREDEIQREACGSRARRVFCVHCRHIIEEVTTNPICCSCCDVLLEVRDHFSRTLAAYIGVVVNAEAPSDAPQPQEQFL